MKIQIETYDEDGDILTHEVTARYDVCVHCEGHGTILNPSIAQHAYSQEEFAESFDEEEAEEYFRRGGRYDITCPDCKGLRVVLVPDWDAPDAAALKDEYEALQHERAENAYADMITRRGEMGYGY